MIDNVLSCLDIIKRIISISIRDFNQFQLSESVLGIINMRAIPIDITNELLVWKEIIETGLNLVDLF